MKDIFQVFLSNSVVASGFFLLLLLTKPLTEKYFSQSWHYLALRVNALLFFFPITPICEKIAPFLVKILPIRGKTEVILPQTEIATWFIPVEDFSAMGEIGSTVGADFAMTAEANPLNWTEIFLLLWVIGSSISLIWHCYCRIRLQKELKPLIPLENPEIHAKFEQCKVEKNIKARIKLFSSHKLYSPLLVGLFRGKILFPNKKMEEKHLEYIFSHELTHFKRGDLWWKALLTPISVIFWWNPLIYYFMAQFELRLEYSCDEKVVKKASIKERKSYGLAILESIDEKKQEKIKLFGVSLRTPEQKLETRLKNMLKTNKMKLKTKVMSGLLMYTLLLGVALPTLAKSVEEYKINPQPHLMEYEEFHLNQGFSIESMEKYPDLNSLVLTDFSVHKTETGDYLFQPKFYSAEVQFDDINWHSSSLVSPVLVHFSDGTEEETLMEVNMYGGGVGETGLDISAHGHITRSDVVSFDYLGTKFEVYPSEQIDLLVIPENDDMEVFSGIKIPANMVDEEIQMLEEGNQGIEIVPVDVEDDSTARDEVKPDSYYIESAETQFYSQINSLRDADYYISDSSNGITYFATEEGTNIYPYAKGTVIESGFEINAGNQVVILHEDGNKTQYRHCKDLFVSVGDEVDLNDVIATVGRTGNVTGYALGFGIFSK